MLTGSVQATHQTAVAASTPTVAPARITPLSASASAVGSDSETRAGTTDRSASVNATEVAALLDKAGANACSDETRAVVSKIFSANSVLLDTCLKESGYMLFPFAGYFPREGQSSKVCASPSCMDMLSGIVLAKLPDCTYDKYSPKSLAESFFRVRVDLANEKSPPSATEFMELYELNMLLNALKENATLQATVKPSFSVADVTQALNPAEINPDVVLGANYVIYVQASSGSAAVGDTTATTSGSKANETSSSPASSAAPSPSPVAVNGDGAGSATSAGKLSVSYFFIGFAWIVFNASYFILMSRKD